jgi:hypothetical protein
LAITTLLLWGCKAMEGIHGVSVRDRVTDRLNRHRHVIVAKAGQ